MNGDAPAALLLPAGARRLAGQPAAPGLALGRIVVLRRAAVAPASRNGAAAAGPSLDEAVAEAARQLQALHDATADRDARKVIEFQIEFLGDPALLEPARAALDGGAGAAAAWCVAIDAQIDEFAAAGDDYFRHRVGDLRDMRERVLAVLAGQPLDALSLPADAIVLADDLPPSRFLATPWQPDQAIVLRSGSATAHVALLARARRVPMVVGVGDVAVDDGCRAIVDGSSGTVDLAPDASQLRAFELARAESADARRRDDEAARRPAATAYGERVQVMLNVSALAELDGVDPALCDGIGLVRTELLFEHGPPAEEAQLDFYRRLLQWAGERPVVIRTLDAGGDKPIPGLTIDGESHPFLGQRGVRLSLARVGPFKAQLRALLRAAPCGTLRIMLPMITTPGELRQVRALLAQCADELAAAGTAFATAPLGMMVEVPAAALSIDEFDADFASIGSNDLLQYAMAAARDNPAVAGLASPAHPGFDAMMREIVRRAAARRMPLSLCGDLAAQPPEVPRLLGWGLRSLSMPAAAVGAVKRAIAAWTGVRAAG